MSTSPILWRVSVLLFIGAGLSILTFNLVGSTVDTHGILHEPFFLIPLFWLLTLMSIITALLALIVRRSR